MHVRIGNQLETLMNRVRFQDGFLTGTRYGTIPSTEARAHPHHVSYRLLLEGTVLSGFVTTAFTTERPYGNLPSYMRLVKKSQ